MFDHVHDFFQLLGAEFLFLYKKRNPVFIGVVELVTDK
jgi:hypothetical protein